MENLGTSFAEGIIVGFLKLLPLLITILILKYLINRLLEKTDKKEQNNHDLFSNKNSFNKSEEYLSVTQIANHFKINPKDLNIIFSQLKWSYKSGKWWIATDLGIMLGAKQFYDPKTKNKYIKWEASLKEDEELINKINNFKASKY